MHAYRMGLVRRGGVGGVLGMWKDMGRKLTEYVAGRKVREIRRDEEKSSGSGKKRLHWKKMMTSRGIFKSLEGKPDVATCWCLS